MVRRKGSFSMTSLSKAIVIAFLEPGLSVDAPIQDLLNWLLKVEGAA